MFVASVIDQNERKLSSSSWQQIGDEKMNSLKNGYNRLIIYRPGASHQESGKRRDKNSIRRWNMWTRGSNQRNRQLKECLRGKLICIKCSQVIAFFLINTLLGFGLRVKLKKDLGKSIILLDCHLPLKNHIRYSIQMVGLIDFRCFIVLT